MSATILLYFKNIYITIYVFFLIYGQVHTIANVILLKIISINYISCKISKLLKDTKKLMNLFSSKCSVTFLTFHSNSYELKKRLQWNTVIPNNDTKSILFHYLILYTHSLLIYLNWYQLQRTITINLSRNLHIDH